MKKFLPWTGKFHILSSAYCSCNCCQFKSSTVPKYSWCYKIKNLKSEHYSKLQCSISHLNTVLEMILISLLITKIFKKLIIYLQAPEAVGYSAPVLQFWKPLSGFLYCFWLLPSPDQPDLASRFGWWLKKPVHFASWTWNQWHWQSHAYPRNEWKQNVRPSKETGCKYKFRNRI